MSASTEDQHPEHAKAEGAADPEWLRAALRAAWAGCQDTQKGFHAMDPVHGPPMPRQARQEGRRWPGRGGSTAPSLPVFLSLSLSGETCWGLVSAQARSHQSWAVTVSPHLSGRWKDKQVEGADLQCFCCCADRGCHRGVSGSRPDTQTQQRLHPAREHASQPAAAQSERP